MNMRDNTERLAAGAGRSTARELLKVATGTSSQVPEPEIARYLYERYVEDAHGWKRRLYYSLKPMIPRPIQIALRQRFTAVQAAAAFPAWPIEPVIPAAVGSYLRALLAVQEEVFRLAYWPAGHRFAFAITHDVEWDTGLRRAPDIVALERRHGFVSSWNLVPERYPIDGRLVDGLRAEGCEIGVHGLKHDGKLFQSASLFTRRLVHIHAHARAWQAVGFRSPSTLRNPEWMTALEFEYDSSFPDTDPYEPQAGGCCSIWPYFLGDVVELPLTMPQDHTLFEILRHTDIRTWEEKARWVADNGGLVLVNVHPDYMCEDSQLALYEALLVFMKSLHGMWHILPRDVAGWWRDRNRSSLRSDGGSWVVEGPASGRAIVVRHRIDGENIADDTVPG